MYTRIKIVLLLAPLLLWGCEKVLDSFEFLESEPKLVLNAPFVSDSTIIIHVSHTIGIMDDDVFNFIDNAVAGLFAGDNLIGEATYIDSGYYAFGVLPLAGSEYILRVDVSGYTSAVSTIYMPQPPILSSIEFDGENDNGIRFKASINDPEDRVNAYGLSLIFPFGHLEFDEFGNIIDTIIDGTAKAYLRSKDINISGGIYDYSLSTERWDDYSDGTTLLIEDNLVNGREFSFNFSTPDLYFAVAMGQPIIVQLESFSQDYITYLKSMELYENSIENPLAEKVTLFTNIDGGLGVAYGKSISRSEIIIPPDLITGAYNEWNIYRK